MANANASTPGDFKSLKVPDGDREMLEDAYNAVTKAGAWAYLGRSDVPGTRACQHCKGEKACEGKVGKKPTQPFVEQLATVLGFASTVPTEALTDLNVFADAIQNNQAMRQMIPDIDQQAEGLRKFQRGELSYAEMRSLCG